MYVYETMSVHTLYEEIAAKLGVGYGFFGFYFAVALFFVRLIDHLIGTDCYGLCVVVVSCCITLFTARVLFDYLHSFFFFQVSKSCLWKLPV